ncbi:MAG: hypothetical protein WC707_06165 [Candidatus Babeliaceae bacterium]
MNKYFLSIVCLASFGCLHAGNTWGKSTKKTKDPIKEVIQEMKSYLAHMKISSIKTRGELELHVRDHLRSDSNNMHKFPLLYALLQQPEFSHDAQLRDDLASALADTCLDFIDKKMQACEK